MRRSSAALRAAVVLSLLAAAGAENADARKPLQPLDVFHLRFADDPRISPDGKRIVYVRNFMDIMKDRRRANLWIVNADGSGHEALTAGDHHDSSPRWSPDGKRLLYISDAGGSTQLYCRWIDSGRTAKLTALAHGPAAPVWSPDGTQIAFAQFVPEAPVPFAETPGKPEGAQWAPPFKVIRKLIYRRDGEGYVPDGHLQLFVVPADGGLPVQMTEGPFDHVGCSWAADGKALIFSANRRMEGDYEPLDTEVYEVTLADRRVRALTDRRGPDHGPVVAPDGKHIAYLGFDDKQQGYQVTRLHVMDRDGKGTRVLTGKLDRDVQQPEWAKDGKGLYFLFDDRGNTKVGYVSLEGEWKSLGKNVGGTTLGRPYASGTFSVADDGTVAYTHARANSPADVAVLPPGASEAKVITALNDSLLHTRRMATIEEIEYASSFDGRKIQGWLLKPPGFDPKKKYPLILEIHGGPFAAYGDRFGAEPQLYAAAGYVVFYCNPRGSTGYGEEFGNLIHHSYPGHDYDDLMAGVDAVVQRGYIDEKNLFVTGGSGGGVLTCWIVGKTDRFRAAVSTYPVINWHSFVLTSDGSPFFVRNWFPGPPWENADHYHKRSPLSLVGNVKTPTMVLTGEEDFRTPISESEQFYKALKLRKVDTLLVRVPGASHNVSARPSHLIAKVAHVLKWFDSHRKAE